MVTFSALFLTVKFLNICGVTFCVLCLNVMSICNVSDGYIFNAISKFECLDYL